MKQETLFSEQFKKTYPTVNVYDYVTLTHEKGKNFIKHSLTGGFSSKVVLFATDSGFFVAPISITSDSTIRASAIERINADSLIVFDKATIFGGDIKLIRIDKPKGIKTLIGGVYKINSKSKYGDFESINEFVEHISGSIIQKPDNLQIDADMSMDIVVKYSSKNDLIKLSSMDIDSEEYNKFFDKLLQRAYLINKKFEEEIND